MWYKIKKLVELGAEPSMTSDSAGQIPKNAVGKLLEKSDDDEWLKLFVRAKHNLIAEGWIRKIRVEETPAPEREELNLETFLRVCVNAELWVNEKPEVAPHFVSADYLIALALIESGIRNTKPPRPGTDSVGPYQFSTDNWKRFTEASADTMFDEHDRDDYADQAYGAAYLAFLDHKAIADGIAAYDRKVPKSKETSGETGPYVASFIDVFLAHIVGSAAAIEFRTLKFESLGDTRVDEILLKHAKGSTPDKEVDALLRHRHDFLKADANTAETTDGMYARIEQRLAKESKKAFRLMQEHIPDDIPKVIKSDKSENENESEDKDGGGGDDDKSTNAPWMDIAEKEQVFWSAANVTERTKKGKDRVLQYFGSTDLNTNKVLPWCGAFVSHCLEEKGLKKVVPKGSARAANWKTAGIFIPRDADQIPRGAIVVLAPAPGSARSGHVGFYTRHLSGAGKPQIELLGGNQSDTVRLTKFASSKVVSVRWPEVGVPPKPPKKSDPTIAKLTPLLDLIGHHESRQNYNAHYGKIKNANPKFTAMTVSEVFAWQRNFVRRGSPSSAVGKYQIIRKTMRSLIKSLKLSGNEKFDEAMQDLMALQLLKGRRLDAFLAGRSNKTTFGLALAKEWASLPVLKQTNGQKRIVKRGQSYYAGDGLNKAHAKPAEVETALSKIA